MVNLNLGGRSYKSYPYEVLHCSWCSDAFEWLPGSFLFLITYANMHFHLVLLHCVKNFNLNLILE